MLLHILRNMSAYILFCILKKNLVIISKLFLNYYLELLFHYLRQIIKTVKRIALYTD